MLLVVVCVGANLMIIWYVSTFNTVFGLAVFIYVHVVFFSEAGKACSDSQPTRY